MVKRLARQRAKTLASALAREWDLAPEIPWGWLLVERLAWTLIEMIRLASVALRSAFEDNEDCGMQWQETMIEVIFLKDTRIVVIIDGSVTKDARIALFLDLVALKPCLGWHLGS